MLRSEMRVFGVGSRVGHNPERNYGQKVTMTQQSNQSARLRTIFLWRICAKFTHTLAKICMNCLTIAFT